jgi:hypothetical protein
MALLDSVRVTGFTIPKIAKGAFYSKIRELKIEIKEVPSIFPSFIGYSSPLLSQPSSLTPLLSHPLLLTLSFSPLSLSSLVPIPGPGEVLVKLSHSGICHSDFACHA